MKIQYIHIRKVFNYITSFFGPLQASSVFIITLSSLSTLQAHPGIGLVYDGDHTIYYTDLNHVWKLNTITEKSEIYLKNVHTHELYIDTEGNLYGEHYWYIESEEKFKNYIWRVNSSGEFEKIRDDQYGENNDFSFVRDQSFSSYEIEENSDVYEIIKKDSSSQEVLFSKTLNHPSWKYLSQNQKLLFVDYPAIYAVDNNDFYTISDDVTSSRFPFSIQSDRHSIYGIWTDREENIFVAIYSGREVKKIDKNGNARRVLKTNFLWSPVNGVFDNNNNLWLMESKIGGKIRVRKIKQNEMSENHSFAFENGLYILVILLVLIGTYYYFKRKKEVYLDTRIE